MFGIKHSLCLTSIVSNAQPSLSMPMKNSFCRHELPQSRLGVARRSHEWLQQALINHAVADPLARRRRCLRLIFRAIFFRHPCTIFILILILFWGTPRIHRTARAPVPMNSFGTEIM